jgi:hypothetical protein
LRQFAPARRCGRRDRVEDAQQRVALAVHGFVPEAVAAISSA